MDSRSIIKTIFNKRDQSDNDWFATNEKTDLKTTLETVDKLMEADENQSDLPSDENSRSEAAQRLSQKLAEIERSYEKTDKKLEASVDDSTSENLQDIEDEFRTLMFDEGNSSLGKSGNASEFVMEFQRKHASVLEIQSQIKAASEVFEGLSKQVEHVTGFLTKAELKIASLEATKDDHEILSIASKKLATEHCELKERFSNRCRHIASLEVSRKTDKEKLASAKQSILRFEDQLRARQSDLQTRDIIVSKYKDQNAGLIEKLNAFVVEKEDTSRKLESLMAHIQSLESKLLNAERESAKQDTAMSKLVRKAEQSDVELQELRSKCSQLKQTNSELETRLDETYQERSSQLKSIQDQIALKDGRITKLEKENELLTEQVYRPREFAASLISAGILDAPEGPANGASDGGFSDLSFAEAVEAELRPAIAAE